LREEIHLLIAEADRAFQEGRLADANLISHKAFQSFPNDPRPAQLLGAIAERQGNYEVALIYLSRAAKLAPHLAIVHIDLGAILEGLGRNVEAKREFKRAVAVEPQNVQALYRYGLSQLNDVEYEFALDCGQRILEIEPDSVSGHLLLSMGYAALNEPFRAADHASKALESDPNNVEALSLAGNVFQSIGRMDEAREKLERSIEIEPYQGFPYFALVRGQRIQPAQYSLVEKMEKLAMDPRLGEPNRGEVEFALGKAYADLGDYQRAMEHYDEANRVFRDLKFRDATFDRSLFADNTDFVIQYWDEKFLRTYREAGSADNLPTLVVGMIRSGTTLAEQILSSHRQIGPAGELRFWLDNRLTALEPPGDIINLERLKLVQENYLALLRNLSPGKARVVDKMPGNFALLGLIHMAFPQARVIHFVRNPIDTCLSIWMTPNRTRIDWASEKGDIVFAYREYLRVMDHWRRIIPSDRLLEVRYEELISEPERVIRQMIQFCDLPWDEACLHPERNVRAVATPSAWQVRQPLYTDAVERWRKYEPWLGEFRQLLDIER